MSGIAAGTKVEWSSHAGGYGTKKHCGRVLGFLPAGVSCKETFPGVTLNKRTYDKSSVDRYVVEVEEQAGAPYARFTRKRYFAPLASTLEVQVL